MEFVIRKLKSAFGNEKGQSKLVATNSKNFLPKYSAPYVHYSPICPPPTDTHPPPIIVQVAQKNFARALDVCTVCLLCFCLHGAIL